MLGQGRWEVTAGVEIKNQNKAYPPPRPPQRLKSAGTVPGEGERTRNVGNHLPQGGVKFPVFHKGSRVWGNGVKSSIAVECLTPTPLRSRCVRDVVILGVRGCELVTAFSLHFLVPFRRL